jgi:hypothetical protein
MMTRFKKIFPETLAWRVIIGRKVSSEKFWVWKIYKSSKCQGSAGVKDVKENKNK